MKILIIFFTYLFFIRALSASDLTDYNPFPKITFLTGFSNIEPWGVWSEQKECRIELDNQLFVPLASHRIKLSVQGFVCKSDSTVSLELTINSSAVQQTIFTKNTILQEIELLYNKQDESNVIIDFHITGLSSPYENNEGNDFRKLGIGISKVTVNEITIFDNLAIESYSQNFCGSLDFRKKMQPSFKLFDPTTYKLETLNYGEESFYRSTGWNNGLIANTGSEVFTLENIIASISTDSCIITDAEAGQVLNYTENIQHIIFKTRNLKNYAIHFPGRTCLFRPNYFFSTHYYDFMLYFFPTIYFLSQKFPDMKFFMHQSLKRYEKEGLTAIDFPEEKIIPIEKYTTQGTLHASFEEAYFSSFSNVDWKSGDDKEYFPEIIDFLRDTFLPLKEASNSQKKRKIYISRLDTLQYHGVKSIRSPRNELEITEFLKTKGFEIITLEGKSIKEQADIFSSSAVIIAPHGAGLTNIVFCNPGTKIFEFFSSRWFSLAYVHLSSLLNLEHGHIMCDAQGVEGDVQANFYVALSDIQTYLEINGISDSITSDIGSFSPSAPISTTPTATSTDLIIDNPANTRSIFAVSDAPNQIVTETTEA